jgi:cell division protein FtsB
MKKWYSSICVVLISLVILFFVLIGFSNLLQYLKLIPWSTILNILIILIGLGFLVDFTYVILTQKSGFSLANYIFSRWGLFFQMIGRWLIKIENFVLLLIIVGGLLFTSTFIIGVTKTYQTISVGVNKAIKYDTAIADLREKYQKEIDKLVEENTDLKIEIDFMDNIIQDKDDQLFLLDKQNQSLQVEIKRLLPKGAKKNFLKP